MYYLVILMVIPHFEWLNDELPGASKARSSGPRTLDNCCQRCSSWDPLGSPGPMPKSAFFDAKNPWVDDQAMGPDINTIDYSCEIYGNLENISDFVSDDSWNKNNGHFQSMDPGFMYDFSKDSRECSALQRTGPLDKSVWRGFTWEGEHER